MQVLKFGGTSIGSPERMKRLYSIIKSQPAEKKIIVLSAVGGTTDELEQLIAISGKAESEKIAKRLQRLKAMYDAFIEELLNDKRLKDSGKATLSGMQSSLRELLSTAPSESQKKEILGWGELLSTFLFFLFLQEKGEEAVLLSALDFMEIGENHTPRFDLLGRNLKAQLKAHADAKILITQGYICRNQAGQMDNLKRGGSDYSASLIGAALGVDEIQIWTDIDGVHNNDPRYVAPTTPVAQLSFDEAAELAYFGAKVLHPQSVIPAKQHGIPVRLLNTLRPDLPGTLISKTDTKDQEIVAIAGKDQITMIRIQSSRMLLAYGFLRQIFQIFEDYQTPIDMITTAEVTVSLTIDDPTHLEQITEKLQSFGQVQIEPQQSIICVVGDFGIDTHHGYAAKITKALMHIPIRMISYGGSEHNISFLMPQRYKTEALNTLNKQLFLTPLTYEN